MSYRIILLYTLCFSLLAPLAGQGTVNRAKARAERRANQRIDQKIDQEIDKVFTSLFSKKKDTASEESARAAEDSTQATTGSTPALFGGDSGDFEPYENDVPFSLSMSMTEKKRNREEHMSIRLGASTDRIAMITQGENGEGTAHVIFDTQSGKTTMITTDKQGKTQGFRVRMPKMGNLMNEVAEDLSDDLKITRTGERRTIDGYDCELVIVENTKENNTTRSWITQDLPLNGQEVFGSFGRMTGGSPVKSASIPPGLADIANGFPIQSTTVDGNTTIEMHFTDILTGDDIDRSLFQTGGVVIQEIGF